LFQVFGFEKITHALLLNLGFFLLEGFNPNDRRGGSRDVTLLSQVPSNPEILTRQL
jgi:hypothetical protein